MCVVQTEESDKQDLTLTNRDIAEVMENDISLFPIIVTNNRIANKKHKYHPNDAENHFVLIALQKNNPTAYFADSLCKSKTIWLRAT